MEQNDPLRVNRKGVCDHEPFFGVLRASGIYGWEQDDQIAAPGCQLGKFINPYLILSNFTSHCDKLARWLVTVVNTDVHL